MTLFKIQNKIGKMYSKDGVLWKDLLNLLNKMDGHLKVELRR